MYVSRQGAVSGLFAWALVMICACTEGGPVNNFYRCGFPGGDSDIRNVGSACLPKGEDSLEARDCACVKACEEFKADAADNPNHPIHQADCNLVEFTDLTNSSLACTPDQPTLDECAEDPPTPIYRCAGPILPSCQVDGDTHTAMIDAIDICLQPGEDLDDVHNRCRQECEATIAAAEALHPGCNMPESLCANLDYPEPVFDDTGVCTAEQQIGPGPDGVRMEGLAWPGRDGIPAKRPLACRYGEDCCAAYGQYACDSIERGLEGRQPIAERATQLRGTLKVGPAKGSGVVVEVGGRITFTNRPCSNPHMTCPLYVEELQLDMVRASGPIEIDGLSVKLERMTARLARPALGVLERERGTLKLPRHQLSMTVTGEALIGGTRMRFEKDFVLPDELEGTFEAGRGVTALRGEQHRPGLGSSWITVNLAVAQ